MRSLINKLRSRSGESYIEILFAIVVVALAIAMVAAVYSSAFGVNTAARARDEAYYDALQKVESLDESTRKEGDNSVTFTDKEVDSTTGTEGGEVTSDVPVDAYEGGGITSFREKEEAGA